MLVSIEKIVRPAAPAVMEVARRLTVVGSNGPLGCPPTKDSMMPLAITITAKHEAANDGNKFNDSNGNDDV